MSEDWQASQALIARLREELETVRGELVEEKLAHGRTVAAARHVVAGYLARHGDLRGPVNALRLAIGGAR